MHTWGLYTLLQLCCFVTSHLDLDDSWLGVVSQNFRIGQKASILIEHCLLSHVYTLLSIFPNGLELQ